MARKMDALLAAAGAAAGAGAGAALTFVVVVPAWREVPAWRALEGSRFRRGDVCLVPPPPPPESGGGGRARAARPKNPQRMTLTCREAHAASGWTHSFHETLRFLVLSRSPPPRTRSATARSTRHALPPQPYPGRARPGTRRAHAAGRSRRRTRAAALRVARMRALRFDLWPRRTRPPHPFARAPSPCGGAGDLQLKGDAKHSALHLILHAHAAQRRPAERFRPSSFDTAVFLLSSCADGGAPGRDLAAVMREVQVCCADPGRRRGRRSVVWQQSRPAWPDQQALLLRASATPPPAGRDGRRPPACRRHPGIRGPCEARAPRPAERRRQQQQRWWRRRKGRRRCRR
jgi:hypothetical protein